MANLTKATIVSSLLLGGVAFSTAQATPVFFSPSVDDSSFEFADGEGSSVIELALADTFPEFTLDEGESETFGFGSVAFDHGGSEDESASVNGELAFTKPEGAVGEGEGEVDRKSRAITLFGWTLGYKFEGGSLLWDESDPVQLDDGTEFTVGFESFDVDAYDKKCGWFGFKCKKSWNKVNDIDVTVTLTSAPEPVPNPGALGLLGLGLLGLVLRRRIARS